MMLATFDFPTAATICVRVMRLALGGCAQVCFSTKTSEHHLAVQIQSCMQRPHQSNWHQGRTDLFDHSEKQHCIPPCESHWNKVGETSIGDTVPPIPLGSLISSLLQEKIHPFHSIAPPCQMMSSDDSFLSSSVPQHFTKHDGQTNPSRTKEVRTSQSGLRKSNEPAWFLTFVVSQSVLLTVFFWTLSGPVTNSATSNPQFSSVQCLTCTSWA